MAGEELHLDRERAEIFGAIAGQYDRFRPEYPPSLIDDLVASGPSSVLDIGCGTGKVAVEFVRRGLSVLGVELDAQMASVARSHGVPVEVASFEDWDAAGRQFDLITAGASWHWIDPVRGVPKVASLLRPGGTLARFWTFHELAPDVREVLDAVYEPYGPGIHAHALPPDGGDYVDPIAADPAFGVVEYRDYRWDEVIPAEDWLGMVATFSDHQRLGPSRLPGLLAELRAAIESLGGAIHAKSGTFVLLAARVS